MLERDLKREREKKAALGEQELKELNQLR